MIKQNADPIKAMTRSNDGTKIAMTVMMITVVSRMPNLKRPRVTPDMPTSPGELDIARLSRPQAISIVLIIGRALGKDQLCASIV